MPISVASPRNAAKLTRPLGSLVRAALALEDLRPGDIAIRLTDDAELRALNRRWRRIDRATDVLSFSYHGSTAMAISGDLVISMDRVTAQARRFRVTRGRELARLAVHGALHLAGLDHARPAERRTMRRREDLALRAAAAAVRALDRRLAAGPVR